MNEEIDGNKYLQLGKKGLCGELNKYLSFGLARKLVGNIDHYLNEAYDLQKRTTKNGHVLRLSSFQGRGIKNGSKSSGSWQSESINLSVTDLNHEEESKMTPQTIGLSEMTPYFSNNSVSITIKEGYFKNSEEEELAIFAVKCYKKFNKKSLEQCRANVYKCDLNKLLPHIQINAVTKTAVIERKTHKAGTSTIRLSFKEQIAVDPDDYNTIDDDEVIKGQNLNGNECEFSTFARLAKTIYKMSEKSFYLTLYDDVMNENNDFSNTMIKYEMQEWLANYACNRIKYVIANKGIDFKQFRILSKSKMRDNRDYLGFLPKKRRKKLYEEMVKYIVSKE